MSRSLSVLSVFPPVPSGVPPAWVAVRLIWEAVMDQTSTPLAADFAVWVNGAPRAVLGAVWTGPQEFWLALGMPPVVPGVPLRVTWNGTSPFFKVLSTGKVAGSFDVSGVV